MSDHFELELDRCVVAEHALFYMINKPAGLAVHNGPQNLIDLLEVKLKERLNPVHRLDRDTSGLILLARGSKATTALQQSLSSSSSSKNYLAIIRGQLKQKQGSWTMPLSNKAEGRRNPAGQRKDQVSAHTDYELVDQNKWLSLVRCQLKTGRQHQIRKHIVLAGSQIIGDRRYGDLKYQKMIDQRYEDSRLFLLAQQLLFNLKGQNFEFTLDLPDYWQKFGLKT